MRNLFKTADFTWIDVLFSHLPDCESITIVEPLDTSRTTLSIVKL